MATSDARIIEQRIGIFLGYGTFVCTMIVGIGLAQQAFTLQRWPVNLVAVGIVGFMVLPVIRVLMMLGWFARTHDSAMILVVMIVLVFVATGAIVGILW